jgi:hypothetical protein
MVKVSFFFSSQNPLFQSFPAVKERQVHYRVRNIPPLYPILINYTPSHRTVLKSILILYRNLRSGFPSALFSSRVYNPTHATFPAHLILHNLVTLIIIRIRITCILRFNFIFTPNKCTRTCLFYASLTQHDQCCTS